MITVLQGHMGNLSSWSWWRADHWLIFFRTQWSVIYCTELIAIGWSFQCWEMLFGLTSSAHVGSNFDSEGMWPDPQKAKAVTSNRHSRRKIWGVFLGFVLISAVLDMWTLLLIWHGLSIKTRLSSIIRSLTHSPMTWRFSWQPDRFSGTSISTTLLGFIRMQLEPSDQAGPTSQPHRKYYCIRKPIT